MSLFATALLEATRSLLAPVAAHALWNVVGALFLGGVSLAGDYPCLYDAAFSGNPLVSGGEYGFEASAVTLAANCLLLATTLAAMKKGAGSGATEGGAGMAA